MEAINTQLRKLEEKLLEPEPRRDDAFLSEVLADEFREFGSSGRIFNKEQIIQLLRTEKFSGSVLSEFGASALGEGAVLVTYLTASSSPVSGSPASVLRSSVWIYRDGRWQMLFHQGTRVAD